MSKLLIKIIGNNTDAKKKIKDVSVSAKDLQKDLGSIAKASGLVFAGTTAAIGITVAAWRVQEQAIFRQQAVLKSTGYAAGITSMELQKMASALQDVTTFGDEAIIQGQNLLLTFKQIGKDVFPQATEVMLDVATAMGQDMKTTAVQLGKALNDPITGLTALRRVGITFNDQQTEQIKTMQKAGDMAGAQAIMLKELESQFGGAARAAANGTGAFIQMKNVFGDILEEVGKRFTPVLSDAAKKVTRFLKVIRDHAVLTKFISKILGITAVVSGLIAAAAASVLIFAKVKFALDILGIAMTVTRVKAALMMGAMTLGLGLILAFLPEIISFSKSVIKIFNEVSTEIVQTFKNLGTNLMNIGSKIGQLLKDIFTLNFKGVSKSAGELKDAVSNTIDSAFEDVKTVTQKVKIEVKSELVAADIKEEREGAKTARIKAESEETKMIKANESKYLIQLKREEIRLLRDIENAKTKEDIERAKFQLEQFRMNGVIATKTQKEIDDVRSKAKVERMQVENEELQAIRSKESEEVIKLKQEEIKLLEEIENAKGEKDLERAQLRLERFREQEDERRNAIVEAKTLEREQELELREMYKELDEEDRRLVEETNIQNLTAHEIRRRKVINDSLKEEQKEREKIRRQYIKDEMKHGTAVATIKKVLNSKEVSAVERTSGQLVGMQNSRNNTLKSIGKKAAQAKIIISTARGAVEAFTSMATFGPIGAVIGAGLAAAIIAYGAEQLGNVGRAQAGGVVPGIGQGDRMHMMLEPGEIVIPKPLAPTFKEQFATKTETDTESGQGNTFIFQGDVIGDEEFVDNKLIPRISDAVRFRNADLGLQPA